ncbi:MULTISPECIES: hypothetical protein [Actinomyces]|nr:MULTISPECIES: hypothetical protein [Actinomyces]
MNDQLIAVVVDEGDELQEATGRIDGDHEPTTWVVLVVKRA